MTHLLLILLIVLVKRKNSVKFLFCFFACLRGGKSYPTGENLKPPLTIEQKGMIFLPRLWLLFSPFHFPPKKKREEEKEMNSKNKSHAFLLDRT